MQRMHSKHNKLHATKSNVLKIIRSQNLNNLKKANKGIESVYINAVGH